jgi:chromosome segregation ATPase
VRRRQSSSNVSPNRPCASSHMSRTHPMSCPPAPDETYSTTTLSFQLRTLATRLSDSQSESMRAQAAAHAAELAERSKSASALLATIEELQRSLESERAGRGAAGTECARLAQELGAERAAAAEREAGLQAEIRTLQAAGSALRGELEALRSSLQGTQGEVADRESRLAQLEAEVARLTDQVGGRGQGS